MADKKFIDINDKRFGGLIARDIHMNQPWTSKEMANEQKEAMSTLRNKCAEWEKLLSSFLSEDEVKAITNLLHPDESQATCFGYIAGTQLNIDKIDDFFKKAARSKSFISRDGEKTTNFKETSFARDLGYALNAINFAGTSWLITNDIYNAPLLGEDTRKFYMQYFRDEAEKNKESMLDIEHPELCTFGMYQSPAYSALIAADYVASRIFSKSDMNKIISNRNKYPKGIDSIDRNELRDRLTRRMGDAFFGKTNPVMQPNIAPTKNGPEDVINQLESVVDQYNDDLAYHKRCLKEIDAMYKARKAKTLRR